MTDPENAALGALASTNPLSQVLTPDENRLVDKFVKECLAKGLSPDQVEEKEAIYRHTLIRKRKPSLDIGLEMPDSIPNAPGETSPFNNFLGRSNLFSPIKPGERTKVDDFPLVCPPGCSLLYSGERLDMTDQDVYLTAIKLATGVLPGMDVMINRNAFLKYMGRKSARFAQSDYDALQESFNRLSSGTLYIEILNAHKNPVITGTIHLMGNLLFSESNSYYFSIPKEALILYSGRLFGYVNMARRRALPRRSSLAKWIQTYACGHSKGENRKSIKLLHELSGSQTRISVFKKRLSKAIGELIQVGEFKYSYIEEREPLETSMLVWYR